MIRKGLFFVAFFATGLARADAPPITAFARLPAIADVRISPDGRYLLYVTVVQGEPMAVTVDRRDNDKKVIVVRQGATRRLNVTWCAWANESRVLCGIHGVVRNTNNIGPIARLVAVNADASDSKGLVRSPSGIGCTGDLSFVGFDSPAQYQDEVIDVTPAEHDTVLWQVRGYGSPYRSVCELNIYTGHERLRETEFPPIRVFRTDAKGNVRLGVGWGPRETRFSYFARLEGETKWRRLKTFDALEGRGTFTPLQISDGNKAYAIGPAGTTNGLWEIDLESKLEPRLIFADPRVDVGEPAFLHKRLLGVPYETDRPLMHFVSERERSVIEGVNRLLPGTFNEIHDSTPDQRIYILRSTSDVDAGTFHLIDVSRGSGDLELLGTAYPELSPKALGRMQSIQYAARDGTTIPAYLTMPPQRTAEDLPVIVMPHDGPAERDRWQFDYLRHFLASRGYAVLQMNYRGSSGYGQDWERAAYQEWGGRAYADIADGARWAAAQAFADPKRLCILGRGFGGYAALLSAVREDKLFQCAVSIAGPTDLSQLIDDAKSKYFLNPRVQEPEIRKDRARLKAVSPLANAKQMNIPVLMIHGTHDLDVMFDHSKRLAAELKRAGKPHEFVVIEKAEHDFSWEADRVTLLGSVETFLAKYLQ